MLTVEQAAAQLGIVRTTTYHLIKTGELASVRIGRARRVPADALNVYLQHLEAQQQQRHA
jgi:excisionase family DNA binding protein